jgi:UDP-N-acetylmuramate: L-alanyl-gamma-D-glutamyl-meso-diaminopimelate ligase
MKQKQHIHFIAIGGAAMHNLAIALHNKSYKITGSDDVIFDPSKSRLDKYGLLPDKFGWFPSKITPDIDAIILGMHAKPDNPELLKAQELGLKIYSYPEYIYEQTKNMHRVVVAGSHGKTTITSMILHVLDKTGKKVNYMVGSQLKGFETMVKLDDNLDTVILEGDEYLSSPIDPRPKFFWYKPHTTILSGIAWDHMNKFPTEENYIDQFREYLNTIEENGKLIYNSEDLTVKKIVSENTSSIEKIPYVTPSYYNKGMNYFLKKESGETIPLKIIGRHNIQNIEAARQVCKTLGITDKDFDQAIKSFSGAQRRLEIIYEDGNTYIFKDFAHAPSKAQASVNAVKESFPDKEVIALLELHTYSSLNKDFLPQYKGKLDKADKAIVFYSPHAVSIKKLEPIDADTIKKQFGREDLIVYTDPKELHEYLYNTNLKGKVLLMMSSGDYGGLDEQKMIDKIKNEG